MTDNTSENQRVPGKYSADKHCDGDARAVFDDELEYLRIFRMSVDLSIDAVYWLDADASLVYVNETACRSLGYSREELLGMNFQDIDPYFSPEIWNKNMAFFRANPGQIGKRIEIFNKRKDGTFIQVETSSNYYCFSSSEIIVVSATDITERKKSETVLFESEERFRTIIESMPLGIHLYRLLDDGQIVFEGGNLTAEKMIGKSNQEMTGKTFDEISRFFSESVGSSHLAHFRQVLETGITWSTEVIYSESNERGSAYELHVFRLQYNRIAIVFSDISERKYAERVQKFRTLILKTQQETSPDSILIVGPDSRVLSYNQNFIYLWNIPAELYNSDDDEIFLEHVRNQVADPDEFISKIRFLYSNQKECSRDEITLIDGRIIERYSAPMIGDDGIYYGRVWYFRDITAQKKNEETIRNSEAEFRGLFEATPTGAVLLVDRKFKMISSRFSVITGYYPDDLIGKTTRIVYPNDEIYEYVGKTLYATMKNGELGRCETKVRRKDGTDIDVIIYANPIDRGDLSRGVASTLEDVTARKKAENDREQLKSELAQSQKMESIGRLAGGIAHDFNNLLTAIMGNTELAMMGIREDNEVHQHLSVVLQAAESAAELTGQLLAFSRRQIIDPKIVNLNDIIEHMQKMLTRLIGENILLRTAPQKDLCFVKVDVSQIQQIIVNLVVNARDAMSNGGILTIETANVVLDQSYCEKHAYAGIGEHAMLSVTDTGIGIPDEARDHLFEPFYTTKAIGKGTGLGLATVYGAVQQNNGTIYVYSEKDKGTSFKVYFPKVAATKSEDFEGKERSEAPTGSETVLLVEDNDLVIKFTLKALERLGYTVLAAMNGEDAIGIAKSYKEEIHLLMTDVILPGMNGMKLSGEIMNLRPSIKVLFNSGYTEDAIVAHGVLNKGLHFIGKPFSALALAHKIREVLDND